jgi:hypothetical protein
LVDVQGTMQGGGGGAQVEGDQMSNAQTIVNVGRKMGASDRQIQIALAAALVESELENVNYGDRDSLGLLSGEIPNSSAPSVRYRRSADR